jgi:hypothetical protein
MKICRILQAIINVYSTGFCSDNLMRDFSMLAHKLCCSLQLDCKYIFPKYDFLLLHVIIQSQRM